MASSSAPAGRAKPALIETPATSPNFVCYSTLSPTASRRFTKVIVANVDEAAHVLDGLLDHKSELVIHKHATDTAGAVDHVFGLCLLFDFRFAPSICDLNERRLYGLSPLEPWPTLRPPIAGPINIRAIEDHTDKTLRLAALIRARIVNAAVILRKLASSTCQNSIARRLFEIVRVKRTLFLLD